MSGARLRFLDLGFTWPGTDAAALAGLSLTIEPREVVAVFGPPGSGTTAFLLVAGGFAPRLTGGVMTGEVTSTARRPGVVFATPWTQLTGLCRTVRAEVAFGPASFGWPAGRVLGRTDTALDRLGIAHLAERNPAELSGGEVQRVVLASALALDPDLLLLDDPAAELDPAAADECYAMLPLLAGGGCTVLVATRDESRAARVATRTLRLEAGRLVSDKQRGAP